jgi:hypothetical protein
MNFAVFLIAFVSGMAAAMGLGGGTFLIIWLTAFAGFSQTAAQAINLIFFIPTAAIALWLNSRSGFVKWRKILPAMLFGVIAAAAAAYFANRINPEWLRRMFGAFVLIMGIKMLADKKK